MITITNDTSQYGTMKTVADFVNVQKINIHPLIVDIGAYDGKTYSNAYPLIMENAWSGILIEPNPDLWEQLYQTYEDAPGHVEIFKCGISDRVGREWLHFPVDGNPLLASLTPCEGAYKKTIEVRPLYTILDRKVKIGIMSIDTEGHDLMVVRQLVNDRIHPQMVITESWPDLFEQNREKQDLLTSVGYTWLMCLGENDVYISEELCP